MDAQQQQSSNNNLGKLRKVLSERCPQCGSLMQERSVDISFMEKGEEYTVKKIKKVCPVCLYEQKSNKNSKNQWRNHRKAKGGKRQVDSDME